MTTRVETAFLPAALELEQRPASPAGRITMVVIVTLFVAGLTWATIGQVDIVAVAPGKIIASGQSKVIQALEIGQVAAIHVHEGQLVRAGDVLIELDAEIAQAEVDRLGAALADAATDAERFATLASWAGNPELADQAAQPRAGSLLWRTWQEQAARLTVLAREKRRLQAERDSLGQQAAKLAAILPIIERRAKDQRRLADSQLLSEFEYLDTEQQRLTTEHDMLSQHAKVRELDATIVELDAKVDALVKEFSRSVTEERETVQRRHRELTQQRIKAVSKLAATTIRSPVDGVVQQLGVHHAGAVVTPAQALMVVVPTDAILEVEATLDNKDVGFVDIGQAARVKVDAFPFTRYGLIDGEVIGLSQDAVADEHKGMVFKLRVQLARSDIRVNGRPIPLSPGMTVTVESMTGRRRLIEYVLSPLLKYKDETARER